MDHTARIATELNIHPRQASATIQLLDDNNTLPFIARYRKEVTGGLDEEQIRQLDDLLKRLRVLNDRRSSILKSVQEQGKLTLDLEAAILAANTLTELEDLYQPYKPKRTTRASIARERGLEPLAGLILEQAVTEQSLEQIASSYLSDEVPDVDDAWAGARDIVAETISDHPEVRGATRQKALKWSSVHIEKIDGAEDPRDTYGLYYQFTSKVDRLRPHQILAMNRGEKEKVLRMRIEMPERDWRQAIDRFYYPKNLSPFSNELVAAIEDAANRLLLPAIERDVRRVLTEQAEEHAIRVFVENLRGLLKQPPIVGQTVIGIDPGYRTGCKVAVVDPTGRVLETATIYPHEPRRNWRGSMDLLVKLAGKTGATLVAIGNGTASRETEQLIAELTRKVDGLRFLIVNEAGASVYSASQLARAELPDLDVSMRGAVSIARRVQDPLAELVKIDPKSIGVGMYQHDVDQKKLAEALHDVVESVVNSVGVDLNTASPALLTYVAGIGPRLAERVVAHRDQHGPFKKRADLLDVVGLGPKAYEQSAGFLRIRGGENPLDASAIHPESYAIAEKVMEKAGLEMHTPSEGRRPALDSLLAGSPMGKLAEELNCGLPTLEDIFEQLIRPGRDPRQDLPGPILRSDVLTMEDLVIGMRLKGTVRNVVDFGAFVDIGVKQDGLLHRSQIPRGIELKVGYVIEVEIQKVEIERGRISLGWIEG